MQHDILSPSCEDTNRDKDVFAIGKVEIKKGISKDRIFEGQGKSSITFEEVQDIMTDEPWETSLEKLLSTLDR